MLTQSTGATRAISPSLPRAARTPIARVAMLVAREKKISIALLFNQSRCRASAARARQIAMYLSHVVCGQSMSAIAIAFGRDRTTVSYACNLIEDLRDDLQFDAELRRLEALLEPGHD